MTEGIKETLTHTKTTFKEQVASLKEKINILAKEEVLLVEEELKLQKENKLSEKHKGLQLKLKTINKYLKYFPDVKSFTNQTKFFFIKIDELEALRDNKENVLDYQKEALLISEIYIQYKRCVRGLRTHLDNNTLAYRLEELEFREKVNKQLKNLKKKGNKNGS